MSGDDGSGESKPNADLLSCCDARLFSIRAMVAREQANERIERLGAGEEPFSGASF